MVTECASVLFVITVVQDCAAALLIMNPNHISGALASIHRHYLQRFLGIFKPQQHSAVGAGGSICSASLSLCFYHTFQNLSVFGQVLNSKIL